MVENGMDGFKTEVVHRDAGEDHVNSQGLISVSSVPCSCAFVSSCGKVCKILSFNKSMKTARCPCFLNVKVI